MGEEEGWEVNKGKTANETKERKGRGQRTVVEKTQGGEEEREGGRKVGRNERVVGIKTHRQSRNDAKRGKENTKTEKEEQILSKQCEEIS